jgi:hypothetical protein
VSQRLRRGLSDRREDDRLEIACGGGRARLEHDVEHEALDGLPRARGGNPDDVQGLLGTANGQS